MTAAEQPVGGRLLGAVREADVAMLQFLGAERLDRVAQRRLVVAERRRLAGVVRVDRLLHRDRAGHRRTLAQRRGRGTEREAGDMPQRQQCGGADVAIGDHAGERVQVGLLLLLHVPQQRCGAD